MLPDRVSNPGPLIYESGALPIALRGPARWVSGGWIMYEMIWGFWVFQILPMDLRSSGSSVG